MKLMKYLLFSLLIAATPLLAAAQPYNLEKITFPEKEKFAYVNLNSRDLGALAGITEKGRYFVLKDKTIKLLPLDLDEINLHAISPNGNLLYSTDIDTNCSLKIFTFDAFDKEIFSAALPDCYVEKGFIADDGRAVFALNFGGLNVVRPIYYYDGQNITPIIESVDSTYSALEVAALTDQGEAIGYYTKLSNGLPETKLFSYTKATGLAELKIPDISQLNISGNNFFNLLRDHSHKALSNGEIAFSYNSENFFWDPKSAAIRETSLEGILPFVNFPNSVLLNLTKSFECLFPQKTGYKSVNLESQGINGDIIASVENNKGVKNLAILEPNGNKSKNYCVESKDLKFRVSGECSKYIIDKSRSSASFSAAAKDKKCDITISVKANGKFLPGVNVLRRVERYGRTIGKLRQETDKRGKTTFTFKIGESESNYFIAPYNHRLYRSNSIAIYAWR